MRLVLIGVPDCATYCLEALLAHGKNLVALVLPPESHPAWSMMFSFAQNHNIPTIRVGKSLKEPRLADEIASYNPDLGIVATYPRLLPRSIYTIPKLGTINFHPSLLPQYRGSNPYYHVIANGEKMTGLTIHYIDDTFDTGDIIQQIPVPIAPDETLGTLFSRLAVLTAQSCIDILEKIEKGDVIPRIPQDTSGIELIPAPVVNANSEILRINWSDSAEKIDRIVRASSPFFGAYTFYRNIILKIWSGYYEKHTTVLGKPVPGTIHNLSKSTMGIITGSGVYFPTVMEYGAFYIVDTREFIKRNNPKSGEVLN